MLLDRIVSRKYEEAQAVVWFPRETVDADTVQFVLWRENDALRTGTIMEWFEYRGAAYVRVTPREGNIGLKALAWQDVAYVL